MTYRRFRLPTAVALASLLLCAQRAHAQIIINSFDDEGAVFFDEGDLPEGLVLSGVVAAEAGQSAKPSERAEKLKKLEYDRRASTILKAWSTPPKEDGSAPAEETGASGEQPTEALDEGKGEDAASSLRLVSPISGLGSASVTGAAVVPAVPLSTAAASTSAPASGSAAVAPDPSDPEAAAKAAADAEAAADAAEAARVAAEEAARKKAENSAFDKDVRAMQRNVTLGDWTAVKAFFDTLDDNDHKAGYDQLLQSLRNGPKQRPQVPQQGMPYVEKNVFAPADVVGLASLRRGEIGKPNLELLGGILSQSLAAGHQIETFLGEVRPSIELENFAFNKRSLAYVLVHAGRPFFLEGLLPTLEEAQQADDREGLNLLSRYDLSRYADDKKVEWLEAAWRATQAVLAVGEVDAEAKAEALKRAVDIAPKIRAELGARWLDESFSERPERGMEILATIGAATSTTLAAEPMDADKRLKLLELQSTATKALLTAAPELADEWKDELEVLADAWLREALFTYANDDSTSLGPQMQRDYYGNFFYFDGGYNRRGNMPTPLRTDKVLETRPSDDWLARIDPTLRPRFQMLFAQLLLKVGEDAAAFPYIEGLATSLPSQAKTLVAEFLRVWIKNHDPNSASRRQNQYIFFYGFEERASGIPLTRSKQDRNLKELGEWIARLRTLDVEIDKDQLAQAFKTAHSTAEVYRLETIEQIFGPMETLDPQMLAELLQTMRTNLLEVWRDPALQKDKKTNRKQQDIQSEVLRGYELAHATLQRALDKHSQDWRLWLAEASIEHDENNFRATLSKDSQFASRRDAAFATFHKAADLYAAGVGELEQSKETTEPYELWFYAALGACDLKAIEPKNVLAAEEIGRIRERILALPGERAERHMDKFASTLFSRMSNANPGVKFRYVREGLAIVGDNKLAREAKNVFDYYSDLVTEIQLVTTIDGTLSVGHGQPFGLKIDLRHTREIERESGGFGKYLQNQNNQSFSFNYGRPTEDYRDKFEESAREALKEHFDVLSVTFNDPRAHSIADSEYGWRRTPYAYVLLKPRGPQVDRIPSLRLDLDFLDTSGYAVLPVESSVLAIDAGPAQGDVRPFDKLDLVQTLDERQAKGGKLIVEIKATANGVVPPLDAILDFRPKGFEIAQIDDQGASIVKFHDEADAIVSERLWTITMRAAEGAAELPEEFEFPAPKVETASLDHFRYVDADLASVEPRVRLERNYGEPRRTWMYVVPLALVAVFGFAFAALRLRKRPAETERARFRVPDQATAFNVLGLLREIHANNGLAASERSELEQDIATLERNYFAAEGGSETDLRSVATRWAARAR